MRNNMKKALCITTAMVMTMSTFVGCGDTKESASASTESVVKEEEVSSEVESEAAETETEVEAEVEDARDLGGAVITICNWADVFEPEEKQNAQEESLWEYRNEKMDEHNFELEELAMTTWDGTLEMFSTSTMAGTPEAEVFRFHPNFVVGAINSGLCFDIATLDSIDITDEKWNQNVIQTMTRGESVYGISAQAEPRYGIFFNKRLFEEAGLDPDLLYDLQLNDEWTWEKFEEISAQVTKDNNNDGVYDTYATSIFPGEFFQIAVLSNDAKFVDIDENGEYFNNTAAPETMEALQWAADYCAKDYDTSPEFWDGHAELFLGGTTAMFIGDRWKASIFKDMEDDYGFVCFPKGPSADNYTVGSNDEIWVIPNSYSKEEAEDIMYALDVWSTPAPGYDDEEGWMSALYPMFRDDRAVEETNAIMREPGVSKVDYVNIIPAISPYVFGDAIFYNGSTVAESLEAQKSVWQAELDKANNK